MHLLRALTTPVTPKDNELRGRNWNRGFERLRASVNPPYAHSLTQLLWMSPLTLFSFWIDYLQALLKRTDPC